MDVEFAFQTEGPGFESRFGVTVSSEDQRTPHGEAYFTCDGIHSGRVEPASPIMVFFSWVGSMPRSPVPASLHLLTLQFKTNPPFGFWSRWRNGDVRDRQKCAYYTCPFVGLFCRSVGAQSTAQPWTTDVLTPTWHDEEPTQATFDIPGKRNLNNW